jgi:hypothetical protein
MHVIACTQRPGAETIRLRLKAQFSGKVAAFFCKHDNRRVILDALPPPWLTRGRAVWKGEASDHAEFQVPYGSEAVWLRSARNATRVVEPDYGGLPGASDEQFEEAA